MLLLFKGLCEWNRRALLVVRSCNAVLNRIVTCCNNFCSVPIGQASALELPAGMMDGNGGVAGVACQEMEEECGIVVKESELIDLTQLACQEAVDNGHIPFAGIAPSPGGCDEFIRCMYLEKKVTRLELEAMKGRLSGLRGHGEIITLQVVPFHDVWKVSADVKAMWYVLQLMETCSCISSPVLTLFFVHSVHCSCWSSCVKKVRFLR